MEVTGHVVGLAHVRHDELPHVLVALTGDVQLARWDPQPSSNTSRPPAPIP